VTPPAPETPAAVEVEVLVKQFTRTPAGLVLAMSRRIRLDKAAFKVEEFITDQGRNATFMASGNIVPDAMDTPPKGRPS
jgi:hypothetical protein